MRVYTTNILRFYRSASAEHVAAGTDWYDEALRLCRRAARGSGHSTTHAVVALAHLSPRTSWTANLAALGALLHHRERPAGVLGRSWVLAESALSAESPLETFSPRARKTQAFAQAILGDTKAVVVDVWAARIAGAEESLPSTQWGYVTIAEAYRRAGSREGIAPRELQAITWCAIRGRAN